MGLGRRSVNRWVNVELSKKEVIEFRNQLIGAKIINLENIKQYFWRIVWGMASAMAGMVLHCLTFASYENAFLLSSIVALFVLPSVLSFVVIEKLFQKTWLKHLGFILPVAIVIGLAICNYFIIRQGELEMGGGDGSLEMLIITTVVYFIGVTIAYAFLLLRGILTKQL